MLSFISSTFARVPPARHTASSATSPTRAPASPMLPRSAFVGGAALLTALAPVAFFRSQADSSSSPSAAGAAMSLSDLSGLKTIEGQPLDTAQFAGKVVFAMNVASACGFTKPGYDLLKSLTDKYSPDDFVAIAIPCNSFMWQESGSPEEIKTFALAKADKLVVTEKSDVNGDNPHPIVGLAKTKFPGRVGWNFDGRFVFNRDGVPVARFGNKSSAKEIMAAIDKCL